MIDAKGAVVKADHDLLLQQLLWLHFAVAVDLFPRATSRTVACSGGFDYNDGSCEQMEQRQGGRDGDALEWR